MSRFRALLLCLCHHTLGAADHLLIDGTFGFTIEANLLESFTGQGLLKGEKGGLGHPKNKAIHRDGGGKLNAQSFYGHGHTKHKYLFSFPPYSRRGLASSPR